MDLETINRIIRATTSAIAEGEKITYNREIYHKAKEYLESKLYLGFYGLRGVGKTTIIKTLLAQASKKYKCAYVNCEASYLLIYSLDQIIVDLERQGYEYLFIDEIHEKSFWERALLTAFDETKIKIIFTGSSALAIQTGKDLGDLTRKASIIRVPPISFREFLLFRNKVPGQTLLKLTLEQIISNTPELAAKYFEVQKFFPEYTRFGGLMYDLINTELFSEQVLSGIKRSLEKDIGTLKGLGIKEQNDVFSILYILARSSCYELTKENLGLELGISWREVQKLLDVLEKIGFITIINACGKETERKATGKIYLSVPLRYVLTSAKGLIPDIGTSREEFFIQHMTNCSSIKNICYPKGQKRNPDFITEGKTFEIGGSNKSKSQNADYYVLDGVKNMKEKVIPLFLFGFLY